jgi:hypothetical protein
MEDSIVLQAMQESARLACVEALQGKFAAAALLTTNSKEKVVSWSAQESEAGGDPETEGERDAAAPSASAALSQGNTHHKPTRADKLTAQLGDQERIAASASARVISLREDADQVRAVHSPTPSGKTVVEASAFLLSERVTPPPVGGHP